MSALLAAAVTFVVNTNIDEANPSDGVMSLREAVAAAEADPGPNIITFSDKKLYWQPMKSALELRPSGPLVINGDIDDDGLADVVLANGYAEKLIVLSGADVTVVGVDFSNGSAHSEAGANGMNGTQGATGIAGAKSTATLAPTDGGDGGDGTDAAPGVTAKNVGGIIHNFGNLTLIRVGFSSGYAAAGSGGNGGLGGFGGLGGEGGDNYTWTPTWFAGDNYIPRDGASGGNGGHARNGGNGGNGGNAAGAILNEPTGVLRMTDVTFGGRLAGWLVGDGSVAHAGYGGYSGKGGFGGAGGGGGEGSAQAYYERIAAKFDYIGTDFQVYGDGWVRYLQSYRGKGGRGGNGGNRGNDGDNGNAGDAASEVLNLGAMDGKAALGAEGQATSGLGASYPRDPYIYGTGGPGGLSGFSKVKTFSFCYDIGYYNHAGFTAAAMVVAPADRIMALPADYGIAPRGAPGPDGLDGFDGIRAKDGKNGISKIGIMNSNGGVGSVKSAASLVFVHGQGVKPPLKAGDPPTLDFKIIRLGKGNVPVTVNWRILPANSGPSVSPADFGKTQFPSGSVKMEELAPGATYDYDQSIKLVSLPISLDGKVEMPEGYRFELTDSSAASVILGTSLVSGQITDDSPGPKLGSNKNDTLTGTSVADAINGLNGNDTINGLAGRDALYGGAGNDVINGGPGADGMVGGPGDDTFIVDDPGDRVFEDWLEGTDTVRSSVTFALGPNVENLMLTGGGAIAVSGNDLPNLIIGNKAANIITGAGGADTLEGGSGKDVFRYQSCDDSTPAAPDFINDFNVADAMVDLSAIDSDRSQAGSQQFDFIGESEFSGPGQVRFVVIDQPGTANDRTYIEANVNGSPTPDLRIVLRGLKQLKAANITP